MEERMLKWFAYDYLPPLTVQLCVEFQDLATTICNHIPAGPERTVALRKLLEAKDAAVRAKLHPGS